MWQWLAMVVLVAVATPAARAAHPPAAQDWPMFGGNIQSTSANDEPAGITAANLHTLTLRKVALPGTVDASAIYLHHVAIGGARHDAIFVMTTYGKTLAVDADSGAILWTYTPPDYAQDAGSYRITTTTPVADPDRQAIYA